MSYFKTADELHSTHSILNAQSDITKYLITRYQNELDLKAFKLSIDNDKREIDQELSEEGISPKLIKSAISHCKKVENIPNDDIDFIYKIILESISRSGVRHTYELNGDFIKKSIQQKFELIEKVQVFRSAQKNKLAIILQELKDWGIPMYLVQGKYAELKMQIKLFEVESRGNMDVFRGPEMDNCMNALDIAKEKAFMSIIGDSQNEK